MTQARPIWESLFRGSPVIRFDNTVTGITRLLKLLVDQDGGKAVCESTGGDQRQLDLPLASPSTETEIPVHLAHPLRARAFARACGHEAETDPRDAQVLSRFGSVFQ